MGIPLALKNLFKRFWGVFRDGLDDFLFEKLEEGLEIATSLLKQHDFISTDQFARELWDVLQARIPAIGKGNWFTLLAGFVIERMKKIESKNPGTFPFPIGAKKIL